MDDLVSLHTRWAATVEAEGWANSGIARFDSAPKPPLTEHERAEAKDLFGKRGTRNWTGHRSIAELETDVLLLETENGVLTSAGRAIDETFTLMLGWADRMVHTTGISMTLSVSSAASAPGIGELIIGPSDDHVPQAVMLVSTSYLLLLRLLLQHLDPSRRGDLDAIAARMLRSSHDVEQLLTIEDDEPCLCDHGRTPETDPRGVRVGYWWVQAAA